MSPRLLRRALVVLVLAVIVAVFFTLQKPRAQGKTAQEKETVIPKQKDETRTTGLISSSFKQGEQTYLVEAESSVGKEGTETHFRGVKLSFSFLEEGARETAVVAADDCLYDPAVPKGNFKGHVILTTSDGLELKSDSLVYRGDEQVAKTEDHVEFSRKDVSGSATGMRYSAGDGLLELKADADVRIASKTDPLTEIWSKRASLDRSEGTLDFEEEARVEQGGDTLTADRLLLNFDPDSRVLLRAVAAGGVDLKTSGARVLPGGTDPSQGRGGPRHLVCRKLDINFRPDRTMKQIIAQTDVDLTILPGPAQEPEKRHVTAKGFLIMDCDEKGRIVVTRGSKDTFIGVEPLGSKPEEPARAIRANSFEASVDPETGKAQSADFSEDVEFVRGAAKARGSAAHFDGSVMALDNNPVIEDETGTLKAAQVQFGPAGGDVTAAGNVRHELKGHGGDTPGPFGGPGSVVTSKSFTSTGKTKTATYDGDAMLRSGPNEVDAQKLVMAEDAQGKRTMKATTNVVSYLSQEKTKENPKATPLDVRVRAGSMDYEEASRTITYTTGAEIVVKRAVSQTGAQGDIAIRSPVATLTLTKDGSSLEKLDARIEEGKRPDDSKAQNGSREVVIQQGDRQAVGDHGTYTPGDQMIRLTGENVVVTDPRQKTEGKAVAFHVGGDRISVDGQEDVRTETVFLQASPRPSGSPKP